MSCKICGSRNIKISLLGQNICKECLNEIIETNPLDESYLYYKNIIRIILGYYISERYELNLVN